MKKLLMILAMAGTVATASAQMEVTEEKHSVATNSFWANWFVQANAVGTSFWGSQEDSSIKFSKLTKDYRTNLGLSLAIGKWFTPGLGLRTKLNGFWGRSVISEDKSVNADKYWTLHEQVLFNLSNMLMGYSEERVWNFIPYIGGGIGRNMTYNRYAMGLSAGLLNTFRLSRRLSFNVDINIYAMEADFDGCPVYQNASHTFKNKDRNLNVELGLTYRLGNSTWKGTTDYKAIQELSQSEIDALNAQLADVMAENERLNSMLSEQQVPVAPATITKMVSAPVSVFFELGKAVISSQRDLQDVQELIRVTAEQQDATFLITGYADSETGNAELNNKLSQERAEALAAELVKMGVSNDRIQTVAAGGVDTLNPNEFNRRATVEVK